MPSRAAAALLGAGLLIAAGPLPAQEKKKAKAADPNRVAVADPAKAAEDPDFAVQGEYEGTITVDGNEVKLGVQIVALGKGKFDGKGFFGGLPGAGWNGEPTHNGTAVRDGNKVVIKNDSDEVVGEIASGAITLTTPPGTLRKVERKSPTLGAKPPAGAVVLFANPGDETAQWADGKLADTGDGKYLGVGEVSKPTFGAFTAHVEFRTPWMPNSRGQQRGNSGVYLQHRYELQVLDSFGLSGENNECGGFYQQYKPLVNMCLPPLVWQTYDIDFTPAAFDAAGQKTAPARVTIKHNGVTIHDDAALKGATPGGQPEKPGPGPLFLQNHNDPVVFKNVWVVEKK
jgi:hypothetical protein